MTATTQLTLEQVQELARSPKRAAEQAVNLLATFQSTDEEVRAWASDALVAIESIPAHLVPDVVDATGAPDDVVVCSACKLLAKAEDAATAQQAVCDVLASERSGAVRTEAARALDKFSELTDESITALQDAAQGSDARLAHIAQRTLDNS
ncbi:MAG TPA: hypothetical protein DDW52_18635 [Planctomycetaceae bacterium]|nr:hypothetical protein [Planctomycetaceae bacterium]